MINITILTKLFSEYGPAHCSITDNLHIIFYDNNYIRREIFVGEKNWSKEGSEYMIYINTWSRILDPRYKNLAKEYETAKYRTL